jgi:hypothetical protein
MSTLQLSLLIVVVVVVAGVYLYNLYEERQMRRKMDAAFSQHDDVLLEPRTVVDGESRREPVFGGEPLEATQRIEPPETAEPASTVPVDLDATQPIAREAAAGYQVREAVDGPDPQIECVVGLRDISVTQGAWDRLKALDVGKPVRWLAQADEQWHPVQAGETYGVGAACLLLANRSGSIAAEAIDAFYEALRQGNGSLWTVEAIPPRDQELARASDLDRRCAEFDIQVGLSLMRNNGVPLAGTRLRGVAEAAGFHLTDHGYFDYLHEETGAPQFALTNIEPRLLSADSLKVIQTQGVTLVLDVPRVPDPVRAFDQMRIIAKRLAVTLDAALLDDNRQPLPDAALTTIRAQIQHTAAALHGMHIEPGGSRAERLFS